MNSQRVKVKTKAALTASSAHREALIKEKCDAPLTQKQLAWADDWMYRALNLDMSH